MLENIVLGVAQGVVEWLPVSSEGAITLIQQFFFDQKNLTDIIHLALFLHLGTALAALIYLRKDVGEVIKTLFRYKKTSDKNRKIFNFLFLSTLISGVLGLVFLKLIIGIESQIELSSRIITFIVGVFLLITAYLQIKKKNTGKRLPEDLSLKDGVFLGVGQGLASLPGISRSGMTVSLLLLKKFEEESALRLSFLMSIPVVLAGNVFLNLDYFKFSLDNFIAFIFSFVFGILTIHYLIKLTKKINFGYFVLIFGVLMIFSTLI